jgi:predicted esterase
LPAVISRHSTLYERTSLEGTLLLCEKASEVHNRSGKSSFQCINSQFRKTPAGEQTAGAEGGRGRAAMGGAVIQQSGMTDEVRHCTFSARLDCHYLLHVPPTVDARTLLVLTLHGFGQNPESILPLTEKLVGRQNVVAAMAGPYQFFLEGGKNRQVGYCWGTSRHAPGSIRLHHEMTRHVLNEAGREYGIPPERRILVGFSQSVSYNYRLAATCPDAVRGVIALCGGLPGDWDTGSYQPVKAAVLHIARREDEYYPPEVTEQYAARLRLRVEDVEFHLLEGGHRFPSKGNVIVEGWLGRILR